MPLSQITYLIRANRFFYKFYFTFTQKYETCYVITVFSNLLVRTAIKSYNFVILLIDLCHMGHVHETASVTLYTFKTKVIGCSAE